MSKGSWMRVHLKTLARALPRVDAHVVTIPAQRAQPKREALLQMSFREVHVQPPRNGACLRQTEICAWIVRVWEPQPPEGQEPLEWIAVFDAADHLHQRGVGGGAMVWLALAAGRLPQSPQNGCRMEQRNLQSMQAQWKLLARFPPIALRLLVIRHTAQEAEETPATDVMSQEAIQVLIFLDKRHRSITTAKEVWHAIARLGGYLDRKCDGPPGWQTLWKGWMRVMDVLEGVHLAALLHPS
jgi:hypothetical protein